MSTSFYGLRVVYASTLLPLSPSTMPIKLQSFQTIGLQSEHVTVEVGTHRGEAKMYIVGLGDTAVQESKQRVWNSIRSCDFHLPTGRITTVNLAPASLRKSGPRYDLPIALGILMANDAISVSQDAITDMAFVGELALDGSLRHVTGVLSAAIACRERGIKSIVVPTDNGPEAALIPDVEVIACDHITDVIAILEGKSCPASISPPACSAAHSDDYVDFSDVRGQEGCKRALEIAAAGGHNVLMSGAPGAGKTLLSRALKGILPPLTEDESIEVTQIYSVANKLPNNTPLVQSRPFRSVHHTASGVSIVGGGNVPRPGEITLAHRGVLFLDELAEFPTHVLEVLRQPLEDRHITITRAQGAVTFPADFIMVAAMNPAKYSAASERKIKKRISQPLLDRIDLTIDVQPVPVEDLQKKPRSDTESSESIRARVLAARKRQAKRFAHLPIRTNKEMNVKHIDQLCELDEQSKQLLRSAMQQLGLSARAYHRTIKVARTIADLADLDAIHAEHIAEALQYRQKLEVE